MSPCSKMVCPPQVADQVTVSEDKLLAYVHTSLPRFCPTPVGSATLLFASRFDFPLHFSNLIPNVNNEAQPSVAAFQHDKSARAGLGYSLLVLGGSVTTSQG